MSYCSQCGHKAAEGALFCAKCGMGLNDSVKLDQAKQTRGHGQRQQNRPARQNEGVQTGCTEGVDAYRAIMSDRAGKRHKGFLVVAAAVLLALISGFTYLRGLETVGVTGGVAVVLMACIAGWLMPSERLTQHEYAALPGAAGTHGHQCVFCGGRGIYRHTPYKTNTTLADCSRCKNELWSE